MPYPAPSPLYPFTLPFGMGGFVEAYTYLTRFLSMANTGLQHRQYGSIWAEVTEKFAIAYGDNGKNLYAGGATL